MITISDTDSVRPEERFCYWNDVVCQHFTSATCFNRSEGPFDARFTFHELGPFGVGALQAPKHFWLRSLTDIRKDGHEDFHMSYIVDGSGHLSQGNRVVHQKPGDIALYDTQKPFAYELSSNAIVLKIPRDIMLSHASHSESLCVTQLGADNPLRSIFAGTLMKCFDPNFIHHSNAIANAHLGVSIFNMLLALIDLEINSGQAMPSSHQFQLERGKCYVIANLGNPKLTVEQIAEHAGVSPRTLNRLFAKTGTTPMRWVWQQRLETSHQELSKGLVQSVTDAAMKFGFSELSHYSRSFKAAYGITPQSLLNVRTRQKH